MTQDQLLRIWVAKSALFAWGQMRVFGKSTWYVDDHDELVTFAWFL